MQRKPENVTAEYPADFLALWPGCHQEDCLPDCWISQEGGHCARLARAYSEYDDAMEAMDNGRNTGGKVYR